MTDTQKRPEPNGAIVTCRILPQPFGRLSVGAASLTTSGLPPEAFKAAGGRKSPRKPRRSR